MLSYFMLFILTIYSYSIGAFPFFGLQQIDRETVVEIDLTIQKLLMESLNTSIIIGENDIKYFFYTREINGTLITKNNIYRIKFDISKETVFLIHGWMNSYKSPMPQSVKDAYLDIRDVNVVVVDWSIVSNETYITSKTYVPEVGQLVGEFVWFMVRYVGLRMEKTGLVGHSLGAHVAGNVGRRLGGRTNHLVGLDPAGPLYYITDDKEKLSPGDSQFVQIIHTCAGLEGYNGELGDADYWPNGGLPSQPGCGEDLTGSCSHARSYEYYSESLRTGGFLSWNCFNYTEYLAGSCKYNDRAWMGADAIDRSTGNFYLSTNSKPTFARC